MEIEKDNGAPCPGDEDQAQGHAESGRSPAGAVLAELAHQVLGRNARDTRIRRLPSDPSEPTSRATRVTSDANDRSWSTMVLIVSFSCKISPRTSTVIFFDKSPVATAVVTSAMFRT